MNEAFWPAFLVCAEALAGYAVLASAARSGGGGPRRALAVALAAGIAVGVAVGWGASLRGAVPDVSVVLERLRAVIAIGLLAGTFLLRRAGASRDAAGRWLQEGADVALLGLALVVNVPEAAALGTKIADAVVLKGSARGPLLAGAGGAASAVAAGLLLAPLLRRLPLREAFVASAALAAIFGWKASGITAAAVGLRSVAVPLADAVGRGVHDAAHIAFVVLQLPDHPFLRDGVYQLILAALEPRLHAMLTAALIALTLRTAWRAFARRPAAELPASTRPPARRSAVADRVRRSRAVGAVYALALVVGAGSVATAAVGANDLYDPVPEPAVDDGHGEVVVPLAAGRAADGRMKKWAYRAGGHTFVFFAVQRADGSVAVALDACEVCQPKGYAQLGRGFVLCKFCNTPIPVGTVGHAGGCNPIPIRGARVEGGSLRVPVDALAAADRLKAGGKP